MLMYQKNMFDRYYCITCILSLENFGKTLRKVHFCITTMAHKSMQDSSVLKRLFQSKGLRHTNVTKLRSSLCTLLLMTSFLMA